MTRVSKYFESLYTYYGDNLIKYTDVTGHNPGTLVAFIRYVDKSNFNNPQFRQMKST